MFTEFIENISRIRALLIIDLTPPDTVVDVEQYQVGNLIIKEYFVDGKPIMKEVNEHINATFFLR